MNIEKMQRDYEMFKTLCEKLGDRTESAIKLLTHIEERLVTCPSSERTEYFNSFPGGLLDHALKILDLSYKLVKAHDAKLVGYSSSRRSYRRHKIVFNARTDPCTCDLFC